MGKGLTDLISAIGVPEPVEIVPEKKKKETVPLTQKDKFDALRAVEKSLNKQLNTTTSLIRLGDKVGHKVPSISGDLPSFDEEAIGCGGLPKGRIIEWFGEESCLAENTIIRYSAWDAEGKRINSKGGTIKHLYERFHKQFNKGCGHHLANHDVTFTAPALNEEDRVFHNDIEDVVYTGERACWRISLNDGTFIEATPEHKFLSNGKFIPASELFVGTIVSVHNNTPFSCEYPERINRKECYVKYHPDAATRLVEGKYKYYRLRKSRAVLEANLNNISLEVYLNKLNNSEKNLKFIPRQLHIHHIDEDSTNDSLDNLVVLTSVDHGKLHAKDRHNNLRFVAVDRTVVSIEDAGVKPTYDIKMKSPFNNYVANTFVVHNSGKTTLALHYVAKEQARGGICAYIDVEHALNPDYMSSIGVNVDELVVSQPESMEDALEILEALVDSELVTLIVLDSVAALCPRAELEGDSGDSCMGLVARLMGQAMRKLRGKCAVNGIPVIFINQTRTSLGQTYGDPTVTPGGKALKFFSSLRVRVSKIGGDPGKIKRGSEVVGHKIKLAVVKNKMGAPAKATEIDLIYGVGLDTFADLIRYAIKVKAVEQKGAWCYFGGKNIAQGSDNLIELARDNSELADQIKAAIKAKSLLTNENQPDTVST